jgi:hypothetical protein
VIDAFGIPNAPRQLVYVGGRSANLMPLTIQIPKEAQFVWFTVIGAGGGGARPTAGAAASGGGGGASGGVTHGLFMATDLPRVLYPGIQNISVGGTSNGSNGNSGATTFISIVPSISPAARDTLLVARGGSGGQASGAGGTAASAAPIGDMSLATLALWLNTVAGQAGGAGAIGNGANVNIVVSNFCSGGGGGAGSNVASSTGGRQVSSSALYPSLAASASDGLGGYIVQCPFICIGGCGGGGTSGATGFNGGNAAYIGAGGGGGGNGVTTSGNGGTGGAGAIIMRWW